VAAVVVKTQPCWQLRVAVPVPLAQSAAEQLEGLLQSPAVQCLRPGHAQANISVYVLGSARSARSLLRKVRGELPRQRPLAPSAGSWPIRLVRVRAENWAESWKKQFKPQAFGRALVIKPTWSRRCPRRGQALVELDPGLSFGTGQHATTEFCLAQIVALRPRAAKVPFLDLGTGSGILALAAAKLGYVPVQALDHDPAAVRTARANARQNGLTRDIVFATRDLRRLPRRPPRRFGVICANLTDDLLIAAANRIVARLLPGGHLVVAGVLARQFTAVHRAYQELGLSLVRAQTKRGWRSALFVRPACGE
jgi:ribosomal protein L11 methyltransferase